MTQQQLKTGKVELAVSNPENILVRQGNLMGRSVRRVRVTPEDVENWSEAPAPEIDELSDEEMTQPQQPA